MAGNAFNAWQYGAVKIAMFATWGHFMGIEAAEEEKQVEQEEQIDQASSSSES